MSETGHSHSNWIQPSKPMMRVKWYNSRGSYMPITLLLLATVLMYVIGHVGMGNQAYGLTFAIGFICLALAIYALKLFRPEKIKERDAIEKRNRELLETVREKAAWHPGVFEFIFQASDEGKIDIYQGTVDEVIEKLRNWYQVEILKGVNSCSYGHNRFCRHKAPEFNSWLTQGMQDKS